ncbi:MAG: TonB-dependent receptor domain-containing protein [Phenylobacterium sp.]|uniref:TonB-dependent receptor domain-containing protein n=1 Tax=Phenylobacterium sp. TaxID=1871053 RepID=UPI00391B7F23
MTFGTSTPVRSVRRLLLGVGAAALLAGAVQAQSLYAVNIEAGPLDAALLSLAKQTDQQLFFPREAVAGRKAPALQGRYTPEQALAVLLGGTDLSARRTGPEVLVVQRRGAAAAPAEANPPRPFVGEIAEAGPALLGLVEAGSSTAPTTVEELQVTGSHIRGVQSPSPLVVADRADLERTGQTTLVQALRALPQNFGGGAAEGTALTGADRSGRNGAFGTGINLRGLGAGATLVLVNGRRIAGSGAFGDFADVSSIPTAAVERVEVLLDGASAIYGSDAVGGVVNIILRRGLEGGELRLLGGTATRGEPVEGQASVVAGRRWDGGGALFAYELQRRDALPAAARPFSASADLRRFGGRDQRQANSFPGNIQRTDPVTGITAPYWAIPAGQNGVGLQPGDLQAGTANRGEPRKGSDLLPQQTLNAVYLALDQAVGEGFELTADARYSARRFRLRSLPSTATFTVNRSNPFFVSPTGAASHSLAYSFAEDLPNPVISGTAETLALTAGAEARLPRGWRADLHGAFAQEIDESRNTGLVNSALLSEALGAVADRPQTLFSTARDGFFNPFAGVPGANSSEVLAFVGSGFSTSRSRSRVVSGGLQLDGALWRLPGGELKVAAGVQARRETLTSSGANYASSLAPTPTRAVDVSRSVAAGFLEARAPLIGPVNRRPGVERLEFSASLRTERYSDVGPTTNPRLGLIWEALPGVAVRATYGRSFRAPALREVQDPTSYSPTFLPFGGARVLSLLLNGGNTDLEPETAESWTATLDVAPPNWPVAVHLTGFDVRFDDRIERPVQQSVTTALSDPTLAPFVERIAPALNAADLARITALISSPQFVSVNGSFPAEQYGALVDNRYVNTGGLHVRGLDLTATGGFELGGGRLDLAATGAYILDYEQQVTPASPIVERRGVAGFPVRFRGRATADWTRGDLTSGVAINYVSAYRDGVGARIDDHATADLQLRWAPSRGPLKDAAATLIVRNVFDRSPPFYDNTSGLAYDPANADPIGRYVVLQLTRRW